MAIETKDEVFEKIMARDKPKCPHCEVEMTLWEVPSINFSDGLGWGVPYLYVCFNDECPEYKKGWGDIKENFAHTASYRCIHYPGTDTYEYMPVFSPMGGTGQIIDNEILAKEEALKASMKKGFSILADCYVSKDYLTVVKILTDPTEPARVRQKAAEMAGDIGGLDVVDTISNLKFGNALVQEEVDNAVKKIHKRHFTRECPFCAEIIKQKAKICKHCSKEVAGL